MTCSYFWVSSYWTDRSKTETKVYVKPTNSGLLLHCQCHVYNRYKKGLLRTMLDRAHRLSSSWSHFSNECNRLKTVFSRLKYPKHLVNSAMKSFVDSKVCDQQQLLSPSKETDDAVRVIYHFKTKSQQMFWGNNLRIWAQKYTPPSRMYLREGKLNES